MALEGAFNIKETYRRLLPGYVAEFLLLYIIYEIDQKLIYELSAYSLVFAAIILIGGVFFGAVFYLLAFDEICPIPSYSIKALANNLKKVIEDTGYVIPNELHDGTSAYSKLKFLERFYLRYRDRLPERREDEYGFLMAQYQSYAQLAFIFLTYAIVRAFIHLKIKFFDFTVELSLLTASLVLIFVFFGSGGFIFIEPRVENKIKGLKIWIWSMRLGVGSLVILLVLLIPLIR